jgi:hypothetical protein
MSVSISNYVKIKSDITENESKLLIKKINDPMFINIQKTTAVKGLNPNISIICDDNNIVRLNTTLTDGYIIEAIQNFNLKRVDVKSFVTFFLIFKINSSNIQEIIFNISSKQQSILNEISYEDIIKNINKKLLEKMLHKIKTADFKSKRSLYNKRLKKIIKENTSLNDKRYKQNTRSKITFKRQIPVSRRSLFEQTLKSSNQIHNKGHKENIYYKVPYTNDEDCVKLLDLIKTNIVFLSSNVKILSNKNVEEHRKDKLTKLENDFIHKKEEIKKNNKKINERNDAYYTTNKQKIGDNKEKLAKLKELFLQNRIKQERIFKTELKYLETKYENQKKILLANPFLYDNIKSFDYILTPSKSNLKIRVITTDDDIIVIDYINSFETFLNNIYFKLKVINQRYYLEEIIISNRNFYVLSNSRKMPISITTISIIEDSIKNLRDKVMMPPTIISKRLPTISENSMSGGKKEKSKTRTVYQDNKGRHYIKYDGHVVYLKFHF